MIIEEHIELKLLIAAKLISDPSYSRNISVNAFWWFHESKYILYHYKVNSITYTHYIDLPCWITKDTYKIEKYNKDKNSISLKLTNYKLAEKLKSESIQKRYGL